MIARRGLLQTSVAALALPRAAWADAPMSENRAFTLPITLNGQLAHMLLDTGAERSVIATAAAARLNLPADVYVDSTIRGASGKLETHPNIDVNTAMFGDVALYQQSPGQPFTLTVTEQPLGGLDGLLGGDILQHFTLVLDWPNSTAALRNGYTGIPDDFVRLSLLSSTLLLVPVTLDGQALTALIDTGASLSFINARGLQILGQTPARLSQNQTMNIGAIGGAVAAYEYRGTQFHCGALTIDQPILHAAFVPEMAFDMIMGMDILGNQKVQISYSDLSLGFPS